MLNLPWGQTPIDSVVAKGRHVLVSTAVGVFVWGENEATFVYTTRGLFAAGGESASFLEWEEGEYTAFPYFSQIPLPSLG